MNARISFFMVILCIGHHIAPNVKKTQELSKQEVAEAFVNTTALITQSTLNPQNLANITPKRLKDSMADSSADVIQRIYGFDLRTALKTPQQRIGWIWQRHAELKERKSDRSSQQQTMLPLKPSPQKELKKQPK